MNLKISESPPGWIKLKKLKLLKTIGNEFLYFKRNPPSLSDDEGIDNLSSLNCINLSGLNNIETIGNNFLYNCQSLISIDLSELTSIKDYFLYHCSACSALTEIKLSPKIKTIGNDCLIQCIKLKELDLSGLNNLITIGNNFLGHCYSLETIDLSELPNITSIGDYFLYKCTNLKSIKYNSKIGNIINNVKYPYLKNINTTVQWDIRNTVPALGRVERIL